MRSNRLWSHYRVSIDFARELSYNCTFNGAIINSRETKRRRGEKRRDEESERELRAIRIVVVRDYLCDTSNLKRF